MFAVVGSSEFSATPLLVYSTPVVVSVTIHYRNGSVERLSGYRDLPAFRFKN